MASLETLGTEANRRGSETGDKDMRRYGWLFIIGTLLAGCSPVASNRPSHARPSAVHPGSSEVAVTVQTATQVHMVADWFVNPRDGWVAGPGAIWATHDGGYHWRQQYRGEADLQAVQFADSLHGFAWGGQTLLRTVDGGLHWQSIRLSEPLGSIQWASALQGWAVSSGPGLPSSPGRLYHTVDGGEHWQPVATPFHPLAVAFFNPEIGWAAGTTTLWHSSDGGRHWTPAMRLGAARLSRVEVRLGGPDSVWLQLIGGSGMSQTSYTVVHFSPNQGSSVVAAVSGAGSGPAPDAPPNAPKGPGYSPGPLVALSASQAVMSGTCEACDLGTIALWTTSDSGNHWQQYPPVFGANGIPGPHALSFSDPQHGWLVDGLTTTQILATDDRGAHWRQVFPPAPTPVRGISLVAPRVGFGLGTPGDPNAVLITRNGGESWKQVGEIPASEPPRSWLGASGLAFVSPQTGWAVRGNQLWETEDGGVRWSRVALPGQTAQDLLAAVAMVGAQGVAGSPDPGSVWWTTDGGKHWQRVQNSTWASALATLDPGYQGELQRFPQAVVLSIGGTQRLRWISWNNGQWAKSADGGRSWTVESFTRPLPRAGGVTSMAFATSSEGWVLNSEGLLFRTQDGGRDWSLLP